MEKQHYIINHKLDKFIDSSVSIPGIFNEGEQPDNKLAYGFFEYDPNSGNIIDVRRITDGKTKTKWN